MPNKLTIEEVISRAREIHGDKYDYTRSVFIGTHSKMKIGCPIHGEFNQRVELHLRGTQCPECGKIQKAKSKTLTTEEFIERAKKVHGNRFSYKKVQYVKSLIPVVIICNNCKREFEQRPNDHLSGNGHRCKKKE